MYPALKEPQTHDMNTTSAQIIPFEAARREPHLSLDLLQEVELTVAQETVMDLNVIREMHPEWHAQYESMDLARSSSEEILELLKSAPNSFAKGLLGGVLYMRLDIAAVTGRAF